MQAFRWVWQLIRVYILQTLVLAFESRSQLGESPESMDCVVVDVVVRVRIRIRRV